MIGMPILKINYVRSKESYMSSNNNIYYVYVYLDPRTPGQYVSTFCSLLFKPFYVGYGKNNRLFDHLKEARPTRKYKNSHKLNTIRELTRLQLLPIIFKVATNLSEEDAVELETKLILEFRNYKITNIRERGWVSHQTARSNPVRNLQPHIGLRTDTFTVYNTNIKEHTIIKKSKLLDLQEANSHHDIIVTTGIKTRIGANTTMARVGTNNGMYGRSATKGYKWCIINNVEYFLSKKDVDFYLENNYNITYGRLNKPSKQRIIFEGELKGKYRTNQDISDNPTQCYQIGLIWKHDKPTFKNHKQI
jgi:hypothetical protein